MKVPGFIGSTYESQSLNTDAEKCLNLYPEFTLPGQAKSPVVLYSTPGLRVFTTVNQDPVRAMQFLNDRYFAVVGTDFIELHADGTYTSRGTVASDGFPVTMSANGTGGNQVFIVSGGLGYIFNTSTNVFAAIADADFPAGAVMGGYTDGYFVVLHPDSITFSISALFDGTSWDALDVAQKTKTPDIIRALFVAYSEIWLFGSLNTEVWVNNGDPDFPFAPIGGVIIPIGIAGQWCFTKIGDSIAWLSADDNGDAIFYIASQYQPKRVSNHAVESAWRRYVTVADAECWSYQSEGHTFCVVNFPSAKATWVYDLATNLWHERAYRNPVNNELESHLGRNHVFAFSRHLVGSRREGIIYHMSNSFTSDNDDKIVRIRRSAHTIDEQVRLFFQYFQLEFQAGVGGDGNDCNPQIMLRWSDDGGHTWSQEYWVSAGAVGMFAWRAMWRRLGSGRQRVWEVKMTENVYWCLIDAYCGVGKGLS